ncbi:porin PorA family protein [Embleya sp. NPDC059237]|uniref:porin PorA family protein n=1 Tax=Embleya sp. NPDC059237 TaxID=3346784 RepID=UPI0036BC5244
MRKTSWYLGAAATLLVTASAVTRFAVLPAVHQVPDDADFTMHFAGGMTMLDPQALQAGNLSGAIVRDLPVKVDRHVHAVHTSGSTIVLSDRTVVSGPQKQTLTDVDNRWAVDRKTLLERSIPKGARANPHKGLTAGFPLEPKKKNYPFWDSPTRTTVPATYIRTEQRAGRETYVFSIRTSGPLADPDTLRSLPPAMPKAAVQALAGVAFPNRPADLTGGADPTPLAYTSTTDLTGWVDSETGTTVDLESTQSVTATAVTANGTPTEVFPVVQLKMTTTPASRAELADIAADGAQALWLLGVVGPLVALLLGLALLGLAGYLEFRARRAQPDPTIPGPRTEAAPEPSPDPATVGAAPGTATGTAAGAGATESTTKADTNTASSVPAAGSDAEAGADADSDAGTNHKTNNASTT